ncbi:hypothetical protein NB720_003353 [Pantoea ananatis]|nr:hypothetical protein [Pantoea ananatis]MCW0384521.1 hypothetical protein [Pantoea ananatis]MCW0409064.1 hypothetical protein [Pantoea ananatis]MCW0429390.1 hypothetical protein [Pantoea ananatis]
MVMANIGGYPQLKQKQKNKARFNLSCKKLLLSRRRYKSRKCLIRSVTA